MSAEQQAGKDLSEAFESCREELPESERQGPPPGFDPSELGAGRDGPRSGAGSAQP